MACLGLLDKKKKMSLHDIRSLYIISKLFQQTIRRRSARKEEIKKEEEEETEEKKTDPKTKSKVAANKEPEVKPGYVIEVTFSSIFCRLLC